MKEIYSGSELFPLNETGGWAAKKGEKIYLGKEKVNKLISGWNPYSRVLVDNGTGRFLLPICLPGLGEKVALSFLKRYRINSIIFLSFGIFLGVFCFFTDRKIGAPTVAILVGTLMISESFYFMGTQDRLMDRTIFNYWIGCDRIIRKGFYESLIFSALLACIQIVGTSFFGSTEALITNLGLVFGDYHNGEWWRLFSGAYIHSNGVHLISNIFALIFFFPLAYRFIGLSNSMIIFISANMLAPFVTFSQMEKYFDAFTGISGGIFALTGATWMKFLVDRKSFPLGIDFSFFMASAISIIASYLMNEKSANAVHVVAFVYGAIYFLMMRTIGRFRRSVDPEDGH